MSRSLLRTAAVLVVVVLAVGMPVAGATTELTGGGSGALAASVGELPDRTAQVDFGSTAGTQPGWLVTVGADSQASLTDWANGSDSRVIKRTVARANTTTAVVAAPRAAIGATLLTRVLNRGLGHEPFVERVEPLVEHAYAEPVRLNSSDSYETPPGALLAQATSLGAADFSADGMAWSADASETTLAEARALTNADDVDAAGAGVTVAVIDTGINTANGRVFGNGSVGSDIRVSAASKNLITNETVADDGLEAVADGNGHGTWVASAIAANHSNASHDGYAPDAELLVLKALSDAGSGDTLDIAQAVRYAAAQDADVLSMSLGSAVYSQELALAIDYATSQGIPVVVAAGNSRQTTRWVASPADTPLKGVITVGAANTPSNVTDAEPAYFSQVGPDPGTTDGSGGITSEAGVDLVAPGMTVTAKTPDTSGSVAESTLSGTSMATPQVAAAAALLLETDGSLADDPAAVRDRLRTGAEPMPEAAAPAVGAGYLDTQAAVDATDSGTQSLAMTDAAQARSAALRALSDLQGGLLGRGGGLMLDALARLVSGDSAPTSRHCRHCSYPYQGETCGRCGGEGPAAAHPGHPGETDP